MVFLHHYEPFCLNIRYRTEIRGLKQALNRKDKSLTRSDHALEESLSLTQHMWKP